MYRILREHGEVRERRRQATHPPWVPELWSPARTAWTLGHHETAWSARTWFCLYVLIDIFSRYTLAGWSRPPRTPTGPPVPAIAINNHDIDLDTFRPCTPTGARRKSKTVAELLGPAGQQVALAAEDPNDNPYSESQFKTLKYRAGLPDRFDSIEHAREFCGEFFTWYNHDHRHSGIGLHTPASVQFLETAADLPPPRQSSWPTPTPPTPSARPRCPTAPETPRRRSINSTHTDRRGGEARQSLTN
ncbi:transposase [Pseudonocardia sp. MCCB 268]|nr:transposase [Pseudonocardia cytotoxica]